MKILAFALALLLPVSAMSQSLADVARKEEARRKTVTGKVKVYTNDDLVGTRDGSAPPSPPPTTEAGSGSGTPPAAGTSAKPESAAGTGETRDQKYWQGRINPAREAVARNKVLLAALEARVNSLNADVLNAADQFQRNVIEENLKIAMAELSRVKQDIASGTKAIADIEEARKASVPPGWLR